jgi:hypothetical protein
VLRLNVRSKVSAGDARRVELERQIADESEQEALLRDCEARVRMLVARRASIAHGLIQSVSAVTVSRRARASIVEPIAAQRGVVEAAIASLDSSEAQRVQLLTRARALLAGDVDTRTAPSTLALQSVDLTRRQVRRDTRACVC